MLHSQNESSTLCHDEVNELMRCNDVKFCIAKKASWNGGPINKGAQQLGELRSTQMGITVLFASQCLAHSMAMEQALNDRVDVASVV